MEYNYEIDKQKALNLARENVIYAYSFRKKTANKVFSILTILVLIGLILSIVPKLNILYLLINCVLILFLVSMILKGEELQIYALKRQTEKLYRNKNIIKYGVVIDENQIAYIGKDNSKKSFLLNSIKHITYRSDLNGIFFSNSKSARFVFFVDLSVIDTKAKERIFNILLENLIDKNAQQELKKSLL